MFKEKRVVPIVRFLCCDKCEEQMDCEEYVLFVDPPKYTYKCPKCGFTVITNERYPRMVCGSEKDSIRWLESLKQSNISCEE